MASRDASLFKYLKPSKAARKAMRVQHHEKTRLDLNTSADPHTTISTDSTATEITIIQNHTHEQLYRSAPPIHHLTHYGNTEAVIQDAFISNDGSIKRYGHLPILRSDVIAGKGHQEWLRVKQSRVNSMTRMLESDDYTAKSPATCQKARDTLVDYAAYGKLMGERIHAKNYAPFSFNGPAPSTLDGSGYKKPKGFLDLPAELRNRVYDLVLVFNDPFELHARSNELGKRSRTKFCRSKVDEFAKETSSARKFLRTCKQINEEGSAIFYGDNEFRFSGMLGMIFLRGFMATIGTKNCSLLRKVTVTLPWLEGCNDTNSGWTYRDIGFIDQAMYKGETWRFKFLDQLRETDIATREVVKIFEDAGNLVELNLVFPDYWSRDEIKDPLDLGLDLKKFEKTFRVTLVYLVQPGDEDKKLVLKKTNRRTFTCGRTVKTSKKVVEMKGGLKGYADSKGWKYQVATMDDEGVYEIVDAE